MSCKTLAATQPCQHPMRVQHRFSSQGFTLLEALIGFLILSIGMLGIASLQVISLKAGKASVYGSVATMKVEELFESMRANPTALASYTGAGAKQNCSGTVLCSPSTLAQNDVYWWKQDLKAGLPSTVKTSVTVTSAKAPSKMATAKVSINWRERKNNGAAGSVKRTYSTTANICTGIPC